MRAAVASLLAPLLLLGPRAAEGAWYDALVANLTVPPGFKVAVYAEVPAARSLAVAPSGTVFVGAYDFSGIQGSDGRELAVYALRDLDGDGSALGPNEAVAVTERMSCPNGVAVVGKDLYVAQKSQILKYEDVENDIETLKQPTTFLGMESPADAGNGLPHTSWHGWRYLVAHPPTGKVYVTIGSPCNVPGNGEVLDCNDTATHPLLGSICELDTTAARPKLKVVAHGIRNSLGVAFHPTTNDLWFTENGRDEWGGTWTQSSNGHWQLSGGAATEDMPPGEINRLPSAALDPILNLDYGFPRCCE